MELRIENISKTYPNGVRALHDVTLAIAPGMFGLLGPNGAGKSTLMRTIATLQQPDEGSIRLDGIDVLRQPDEVRKILGYLPQEFGLYPNLSAETVLDYFATLKGVLARGERRDLVHALLQQTNLWEARKKNVGGFSGGMKQRLGIAIALSPPQGQLGDVLTCEGVEQTLAGRHGIYDMKVSNQRGEVVAMFRGKSASIQGTVVPEGT